MLVSILIPCYNAERWVRKPSRAALTQTWLEKEVLVVDDGSTDGSLQIIKQFGKKVRFETGPNRGGNSARNRLLELATGEWVQYLDADDYLLPDKVAKQMQYLAANLNTDVVYGPSILEFWSEQETRTVVLEIPEPYDPAVLLCAGICLRLARHFCRRTALVDVGGWKSDQPCCQEHELYLRHLMAGKRFAFLSP